MVGILLCLLTAAFLALVTTTTATATAVTTFLSSQLKNLVVIILQVQRGSTDVLANPVGCVRFPVPTAIVAVFAISRRVSLVHG